MIASFNWTDEAVARLKQLHGEQYPYSEIASLLGKEFGGEITRNSAIGKARRIGLAKHKDTPVRRRAMLTDEERARRIQERDLLNKLKRAKTATILPFVEAVDIAPDLTRAVTFVELEPHHCRFPIGRPGEPGFMFCGASNHGNRSYCWAHCRIVYQPLPERKPRPVPKLGGAA